MTTTICLSSEANPRVSLNLVGIDSASKNVYSDKNPDDRDIVHLIRQDNNEGVKLLYHKYSSMVFGVVLKIVKSRPIAEQILQDTYVRVWQNIEQYSPAKGRFVTWVLNIARHRAIDELRSRRFKQRAVTESLNTELPLSQTVDPIPSAIREQVGHLGERHQKIMEMIYFEGYTHVEVAKILDMPLGTVKGRVRKALGILRETLDS